MILSTGKALRGGGGQPQIHTTAAYRRADQRWGPTEIRQEMIIQGRSSADSVLQSDGRIKEGVRGQIEEAIGEALSRDTEIGEHQGGSEGEEGKGTDEEEEEDDQMSESGDDESESEDEDESEVETEEQRKERVEYVRTETERRRDQQEGKSKRKKQQRRDGAVEIAAEKRQQRTG
jgi:hypothetical protein